MARIARPTFAEALQAKVDVDASGAFTGESGAYFGAITDRERQLAAARVAGVTAPAYVAPAPLTPAQQAARIAELEVRVLTGIPAGQLLTADAKALLQATLAQI